MSDAPTSSRHAAIVALFGAAPGTDLEHFVARLQQGCHRQWGERFRPRPADTLHTTLIGLDAAEPLIRGAELEGLLQSPRVDVLGLLRALRADLGGGLTLQYGGYARLPTSLTSRGLTLVERSLVLHRDQIVLIGWPLVDGAPSGRLDELRRRWENHGVRHRYPLTEGATDPDAHMVIGELPGGADADELSALRAILADEACRVTLSPQRVSIVLYDDPRLPRTTTRAVPLDEVLEPTQASGGANPSSRNA